MSNMEFRRFSARNARALWAAAAGALMMCVSLAAYGQAALPLPAAGAAPAAPVAPAPPTPAEIAAKARAAALAAKTNIDVTDAWTRATTNAMTAPIYLHIASAKDPDRLIGVEAAIAKSVELRDDSPQAAAKVVANPVIDLAGGATVNLAPGGRYFNLVGLKAPLTEGDSFLLTMRFDKAGTSNTVVKILGAGASGPPPANSARKGDTTAGVSQR